MITNIEVVVDLGSGPGKAAPKTVLKPS